MIDIKGSHTAIKNDYNFHTFNQNDIMILLAGERNQNVVQSCKAEWTSKCELLLDQS